jgi:hypothetical protein
VHPSRSDQNWFDQARMNAAKIQKSNPKATSRLFIKLATAAVSVSAAVAVWGPDAPRTCVALPSQYLELRTALTSEIEHRQQVSEVLADTERLGR